MSAPATTRLMRQWLRRGSQASITPTITRQLHPQAAAATIRRVVPQIVLSQPRWLSISHAARAGIMPESEDPKPPNDEVMAPGNQQPAQLSEDEYQELSDVQMDLICEKAEAMQESREDVEVEYSAGVLNIVFPPNGTYVINKQPPNKQIWLSSPISGPKRYDWVVSGESMHQKEGGGQGEWVYLRDGTRLNALLSKELGLAIDHIEEDMTPSKDATE
ncbi:Frataxin [Sphaerulina musiva SO2202]|uniref:ferroxidase n=1 Tax=Sphaerulina musiva (strain SO2202) TaxID=692275 RepID=N1QNH5_SPHMS|nr:Frataxin [Sphaerulina musiva SO2202]EMF17763.1 Frataxin [Sphaerulina musiva SO2202]